MMLAHLRSNLQRSRKAETSLGKAFPVVPDTESRLALGSQTDSYKDDVRSARSSTIACLERQHAYAEVNSRILALP